MSKVQNLEMSLKIELDGLRSWLVVVAAFMTHLITHGLVYSYGFLFISFEEVFNGTKSEVSWIASITTGSLYLSGPLASVFLRRFGSRMVSLTGAILSAAGCGLSIFAPNLYFLYFSLGILSGVGYGLIFIPAVVEVTVHFKKHRALACGIAVSGAGAGAFAFSPLIEHLLETYAWRGTLLVCTGLLLNCVPCSLAFRNKFSIDGEEASNIQKKQQQKNSKVQNLTFRFETSKNDYDLDKSSDAYNYKLDGENIVKCYQCQENVASEIVDTNNVTNSTVTDRLILKSFDSNLGCEAANENLSSADNAANETQRVSCGKLTLCQIIHQKEMVLFYSSQVLFFLGFYFPFIGIPDMAIQQGILEREAVWIISACGISTVCGRILLGYLSDRPFMNSFHMYTVALLLAGISTSLVPVLRPYAALMIYSVIYGLSTAVLLSQTTVVLVEIVGLDRMSDAMGLNNMFSGIGALLGPPILGLLYDHTDSYSYPFIVSGIYMTLGGILLFLMKFCTAGCTTIH